MKKYRIEVEGAVTLRRRRIYTLYAENEADAKAMAEINFKAAHTDPQGYTRAYTQIKSCSEV